MRLSNPHTSTHSQLFLKKQWTLQFQGFYCAALLIDQWPCGSSVFPNNGRFGVEFDRQLTPLRVILTAVLCSKPPLTTDTAELLTY